MFRDSGYVRGEFEPKYDPRKPRFGLRQRIGGYIMLIALAVIAIVWIVKFLFG